jgi:hypothetical protein
MFKRFRAALTALSFAPVNFVPPTPDLDGFFAGIDGAIGGATSSLRWDAVVATDGSGTHLTPEAAFLAGATTVYVRDGTYVATGPIDLPEGGVLWGESRGGTILDRNNLTANRIKAHGSPTDTDGDFYDGGGTLTVTQGNAIIVGVGTTFLTAVRPVTAGDFLVIRGLTFEVASIETDLQLTLLQIYGGSSEALIAFPDFVILPLLRAVTVGNLRLVNLAPDGANPPLQLNQCLNGRVWRVDFDQVNAGGGGICELRTCDQSVIVDCTGTGGNAPFRLRNGWRCQVTGCQTNGAINSGIFCPSVTDSLVGRGHIFSGNNINGGGAATANGIQLAIGYFDCLILGNVIADVENASITLGFPGPTAGNHTVANNRISAAGTNGIVTDSTCSIIGNCVTDGPGNGIHIASDDVMVVGNVMAANATGLVIEAAVERAVITGNTLRDNTVTGVNFGAALVACRFHGNVIADNLLDVTGAPTAAECRIRGNDGIPDNFPGDIGGINVETLVADKVLTPTDPRFQRLDPGAGGRNVDLPAVQDQLGYWVAHFGAAFDLTVRAPGPVVIATLNINEACWVCSSATAWDHVGIITIALA